MNRSKRLNSGCLASAARVYEEIELSTSAMYLVLTAVTALGLVRAAARMLRPENKVKV